jgi:hypothetical protein
MRESNVLNRTDLTRNEVKEGREGRKEVKKGREGRA